MAIKGNRKLQLECFMIQSVSLIRRQVDSFWFTLTNRHNDRSTAHYCNEIHEESRVYGESLIKD